MALGTLLPFWPALLFTYIEPISLYVCGHSRSPFASLTPPNIASLGWRSTLTPSDFVKLQTPSTPASTLIPVHDGALVLAYSISNVFLLLAGLAILCTVITCEARVAKWYLLMVAAGDLGHIWSSYKVLGPEVFMNVNAWNEVMWGDIDFSAFLHVNRLATVLGVFGRVGREA